MIASTALALLLAQFNNPPGKVDPLWVGDNPAGLQMMDALVGPETRIVCILPRGPMKRCPPAEAVRVESVPRFGQFIAEWDRDEPNVVNVYVFGGRLVTCEPLVREVGVRVRLRRLPVSEMPDPSGWDPRAIARFH
ncbi:MAG: hypothetical protein AB1434_15255, partial [Pseudomonadota bacterium]